MRKYTNFVIYRPILEKFKGCNLKAQKLSRPWYLLKNLDKYVLIGQHQWFLFSGQNEN